MKRPDITNPQALFGASARYKAPIFQRFYVWGRREFDALVEDIDTADPSIGQFLGAIVLKDMGRPSGPASPTTYLLIDGQQRLTTLYLLFLALARVAEQSGDTASADYIWKNYLAEVKSPQYMGWPKLVPTLQDRHTFWEILESALPRMTWDFSADPEEKKPRTAKKLQAQWQRIVHHIEVSVKDSTGALDRNLFDPMLQTAQEHLKLIDITLETDDDANAIFSRLNAKGVPLELADLVRNEVFSKFGPSEAAKADRFFHKNWQPFEKGIPDGALSAFFPVYAYIALRGKVTKAAAFPSLQKKWKKQTPHAILVDLEKYAPFFSALTKFRVLSDLPAEINAQTERLSRMPRTRVTWPFIIEVLRAAADGRLNHKDTVRCLRIVEAFLVRRALVGREPTGLHAVFKTLWERTKGDPKQVLDKIVTRTIRSPTDLELTSFLKKERSDTRVMLRYVLEERERWFVKANRFDPPPATAATLEHILPKHLTTEWSRQFTTQEHESCVGLLGNLAPLSEKQNKSLQDQPWSEKRKRIAGSNFKSTQALSKQTSWTPSAIRKRTDEITAWITTEWKELSSI